MTIKVNRVPQYLLNALRLQSADKAEPGELSRTISGVMALEPYYLSPEEQFVQGISIGLNLAGDFGISLTVPANEVWIPQLVTLQLRCQTGPFAGLCSWQVSGRSPAPVYLPGFPPPLGAGTALPATNATVETSWIPPRPFILRPGDRFLVETSYIGAGSATARVSGIFARLTI